MSSDLPDSSPSPHLSVISPLPSPLSTATPTPTATATPHHPYQEEQPHPAQGCESTTPFPSLPPTTQQPSPPLPHTRQSSRALPANNGSPRRHSIPIAFPPLFQPNASSTSLIHSTAEGKPIPVDDSTAADRTSALRQLNSHYPSRHRYAKSTGAQSSTYSQPVIVRTYPGPPPNNPSSSASTSHRSHHHRHRYNPAGHTSRSGPSKPPSAADIVRRIMPFSSALSGSSTTTSSQNPKYGMLSVARAKAKKRAQGARDDAAGTLPPLEAFTFKSFMANGRADSDDASHSINADLDRIAEICARSRYSLSNQYEVHKAPHGSGESFLAAVTAAKNQPIQGPTLQVVSSDDERQMRHSRRKRGIRRRSVAVGTLETIMSSSRSSEEDKSKKHKSAAEIAEEVRSRAAARKESGTSSPVSPVSSVDGGSGLTGENAAAAASSGSGTATDEHGAREAQRQSLARRKSVSLASAVIENTRKHEANAAVAAATAPGSVAHGSGGAIPSKTASAGLMGEPAQPQTSRNYLEIRPPAEEPVLSPGEDDSVPSSLQEQGKGEGGLRDEGVHDQTAPSQTHQQQQKQEQLQQQGLLSNLAGWIWWRPGGSSAQTPGKTSHAEGSLRELLKSSSQDKPDAKGKGVERSQ